MPFIGIITNKNNKEIFASELKGKIEKGVELIFINNENIQNIRNVTFDAVLLCYDYRKVFEDIELLRKVVSNSKKFIINTDLKSNYDILNSINVDVITYGFNRKSTVTASSIEEDVILCIQRNIINLNDTIIEPQDIKIEGKCNEINIYERLGISILLLIYSKNKHFM